MNRIETIFNEAKESNSRVLLPFLCGGSPENESLGSLLQELESAGASIVEIGIPYSDPIADGPTIAHAMHEALERGVTPEMIFDQVRAVRDKLSIGLVAMVSVSIVNAMGGAEAFAAKAAEAGFDGCIIPDLVFEESLPYREACKKARLSMPLLIAPSTPEPRAIEIAKASTGFVYLMARSGITGERTDTPEIEDAVAAIRKGSSTPIACGFGISTQEQVSAVVDHAQGAIVGSAMVRRLIDANKQGRDIKRVAHDFVTDLSLGLVSMDRL